MNMRVTWATERTSDLEGIIRSGFIRGQEKLLDILREPKYKCLCKVVKGVDSEDIFAHMVYKCEKDCFIIKSIGVSPGHWRDGSLQLLVQTLQNKLGIMSRNKIRIEIPVNNMPYRDLFMRMNFVEAEVNKEKCVMEYYIADKVFSEVEDVLE